MESTNMKQLILAIDDSQIIQLLLKNLLSSKYDIVLKDNGADAFEWLIEGNYPDLIITDLHMPLLNGNTFLENLMISGIWRDIPVIVLTSALDADTHLVGLKAKLLIHKPFNPTYLQEKVDQLLMAKSPK